MSLTKVSYHSIHSRVQVSECAMNELSIIFGFTITISGTRSIMSIRNCWNCFFFFSLVWPWFQANLYPLYSVVELTLIFCPVTISGVYLNAQALYWRCTTLSSLCAVLLAASTIIFHIMRLCCDHFL